MVIRKKEGALTEVEQMVIKALLAKGQRNQDIQALINVGRVATINSARITEVKINPHIKPASEEDVNFFIKKRNSIDPRTGLNLYMDERLMRSREAMILAVQVFNNPGIQFKTEVFAVLANIAWTYLLHEHYERRDVSMTTKDGRSHTLKNLVERSDAPLTSGIRNNLRDIIDIRDDVEHKLLRRTDLKFFGKFQTCCLNFDKVMTELFGDRLSLKNELSVALQFARVEFEQVTTLHKYDIPEHIQALDARLDGRLSSEEKADLEYQFSVVYMLESATKGKAHIQFIKPGSEEGKEIHNVLEKFKVADEIYPYKPGNVCKEVARRTGVRFTSHNHVQATCFFKARPRGRSKQPANTNREYCIYHPAYDSYTYSEAWIDKLVAAFRNEEQTQQISSIRLN